MAQDCTQHHIVENEQPPVETIDRSQRHGPDVARVHQNVWCTSCTMPSSCQKYVETIWRTCVTHMLPALVDNTHWNGAINLHCRLQLLGSSPPICERCPLQQCRAPPPPPHQSVCNCHADCADNLVPRTSQNQRDTSKWGENVLKSNLMVLLLRCICCPAPEHFFSERERLTTQNNSRQKTSKSMHTHSTQPCTMVVTHHLIRQRRNPI